MGNIYRSILKSGIVPYGKKEITINSLETVTEDVSIYDQVEISVDGLYEIPEQLVLPSGNKEIVIDNPGTVSNIDVKEYETASVVTDGLVKPSGTKNITLDEAVTITEDVTNYVSVQISPQGLVKPSGTVNITKNGEVNVTNKVTANVNVPVVDIIELLDWDDRVQLPSGISYITNKKGVIWGNDTRPYSEDGTNTAEILINNKNIMKVDIYSNADIYTRVNFNYITVKANSTIRCNNLVGDGNATPYFIPFINQNTKVLDWGNMSKYNGNIVSYAQNTFTAPYDGYIGIMYDATDCNFNTSPCLKVNGNMIHYGKGAYVVPYWYPIKKEDVCEICDINGDSINDISGHVCFVGYEADSSIDNPIEIQSISVTTQPTKTNYYTGDTLDLTGLVITAYTNKNMVTYDVTNDCTFSPDNNTTLDTAGTITIDVTYNELTTSFDVTVTQAPEPEPEP